MQKIILTVMRCWIGILCLLFAGCRSETVALPEKVQIHWFLGVGTGTGAQAEAVERAFVEEFNASQNRIELLLEIGPTGGTFVGAEVLRQKINNGDIPDVMGPTGAAGVDFFSDLWLALDTVPESFNLNDVSPAILDNWRREGHLIGIPTGVSPAVIFYNKDLFDAAGIPYPPHGYGELYSEGAAWTVEDLKAVAMLLTLDAEGNNASHPNFDPEHIVQWGYHWGWESGIRLGTLFGDASIADYGQPTVIPAHWRQAYRWYYDGLWEDHFIPKGAISQNQMKGNAFASGNVAMVRSYLWYLDNLTGVPFAWDIAALPSYDGTTTVGWSGGMIGVFNTTEYPQEAIEVAHALVTAPELLSVWGAVPAVAHLQDDFFDQLEAEYPNVDLLAAIDGLRYLGHANLILPNYADVQMRFDKLRDGMMRGNIDLNVEIDRLESDVQAMFAGE